MSNESPAPLSSDDQALRTGLRRFSPRVGMVSFRVPDVARSLAFYVGVLGMEETMRVPGFGPNEHELVLTYPGAPGAAVMLMWNATRTEPYRRGDAYNRLTLVVDDVAGALAQLRHHGVPTVLPLTAANGVRYAVVSDPDGFLIELLELGAPPPEAGLG